MEERKDYIEKFDSITEHFIYTGNLAIFWHVENIVFKDKIERKFNRKELVLLSNSSWNLKYCIDIAKYFLNLSSKKSVEELTTKNLDSFENPDRYEDHIRAIEHRFLLPSLLFYNSSFDYLIIFIFCLLTKSREIIECEKTDINKVQKEMNKLDLSNKKYSWIFALNSLITKNIASIKEQLEEKSKQVFSTDFTEFFNKLDKKNRKLRINYYANIIKHQQIPFFKPKSLNNIGGAQNYIDIKRFYSIDEIIPSIIGEIPEVVLDIEKTQKFLIQYHNCQSFQLFTEQDLCRRRRKTLTFLLHQCWENSQRKNEL